MLSTMEKAKGGRPSKEKEKLPAKLQEDKPYKKEASSQAGKSLSVGQRYVHEAKKLKAEHPELAEQVKQGAMTFSKPGTGLPSASGQPEIVQPRAIV